MRNIILTILILLFAVNVQAATYYVRTDGGTGAQCDGLSDASVASTPNCAWNSPNWPLPIRNQSTAYQISGGDTLIIGSGSYKIGCSDQAGNCTDSDYNITVTADGCHNTYPYECALSAIPAGADADNRTKIYGEGWDTGCANPPELYGVGGVKHILRTNDFVDIRCFEITDHEDCGQFTPTNACSRDWSGNAYQQDWAQVGIRNYDGHYHEGVTIKDIDIHGMGDRGIKAGGFTDLLSEDTRLSGNHLGGWDFDTGVDKSNSGDMVITRMTVQYSGCSEAYPVAGGTYEDNISNCCSQDQGCYGDGIGTPSTGGNWVITDSNFIKNTEDGLDLLYVNSNGSSTIKRNTFINNRGSDLKLSGSTTIEDNKIVNQCNYITENGLNYSPSFGNACRYPYNISLTFTSAGEVQNIISNTLVGNPDYLIWTDSQFHGSVCDGTEEINIEKNILVGADEWQGSGNNSLLFGANPGYGLCSSITPSYGTSSNNMAYSVRTDPCDSVGFQCPSVDPELEGITIVDGGGFTCDDVSCDVSIGASSPAIGTSAVAGFDDLDILSTDRGNDWDIGAYEYDGAVATCSDDCSLCSTSGTCEASAATDCDSTGFCCWRDGSYCSTEPTPAACDADNCNNCATQILCDGVTIDGTLCKWDGAACQSENEQQTNMFNGTFYNTTFN